MVALYAYVYTREGDGPAAAASSGIGRDHALKAALLIAALAGTALSGEFLSPHGVSGFKLGYEADTAEMSIREYVPEGESVQDWTRMITDQRFTDLNPVFTPEDFARVVGRGLGESCPGAKAGKIARFKVAGRAAAQMQADCPRNPGTGKPETFIILLIAGDRDLHARQVAWRKVPSLQEINWGEEVLAATRLCQAGQTAKGC